MSVNIKRLHAFSDTFKDCQGSSDMGGVNQNGNAAQQTARCTMLEGNFNSICGD